MMWHRLGRRRMVKWPTIRSLFAMGSVVDKLPTWPGWRYAPATSPADVAEIAAAINRPAFSKGNRTSS
jgi:hypothetical protein